MYRVVLFRMLELEKRHCIPFFMESLNISSLSEEKLGFITPVRLLELEICQKSLSGIDVRREFAGMFPPSPLIST